MPELLYDHDRDISRLLKKYFQGETLEDAARQALWLKTRRLVAAGGGKKLGGKLGGLLGGSRSRRWAWGGLAAGAAVILVGLLWSVFTLPGDKLPLAASGSASPPPQGLAAVVALHPPVTDQSGRALKIGDWLPAGEVINTGAKGRVTLVTQRSSEFTLDADTTLALDQDSKNVALRQGRVYCRNRGEFVAVNTVAGRIELLGTIVDAVIKPNNTVAVTVVAGKVRLANYYGETMVDSGNKSLLIVGHSPAAGKPVNVTAETAWYNSPRGGLSDFGDIAYIIRRGKTEATEVWAMRADGSDKRRIKSFLGYAVEPAFWRPGEPSLLLRLSSDLFRERDWLLNAATGQDTLLQLPAGYKPINMALSPDSQLLLFSGRHESGSGSAMQREAGVWVYHLATGEIKQLLDKKIMTPPAWAPDSRRFAVSTGEGYSIDQPLVIGDALTGEITDLHVQGAGASFSPDGSKLAYCGDFRASGSYYQGVPMKGGVFVLDLAANGPPRRISPAEQDGLQPRWSPDGTRIVYSIRKNFSNPGHQEYIVFIAAADGSSVKPVFSKSAALQGGDLKAVCWAPSGDKLYLFTNDGVRLIDAGGGGLVAELGGNAKDSILSPAEKTQTDRALADLRKAFSQYARGEKFAYEGKTVESKAPFKAAADIFSGLLWRYPLSGFSAGDLRGYADQAKALSRPEKPDH
jgi:Tol biopolymer transport system component